MKNNKIVWNYLITALLVFVIFGCDKNEPPLSGKWYSQAQVNHGEKIYQTNCAQCHGDQAQGILDWKQPLSDGRYPPPPLNGTAHTWHHPMYILKRTIENGSINVGGTMPAFKNQLSDKEIKQVIAYFQNYWQPNIYNDWKKRGGLE